MPFIFQGGLVPLPHLKWYSPGKPVPLAYLDSINHLTQWSSKELEFLKCQQGINKRSTALDIKDATEVKPFSQPSFHESQFMGQATTPLDASTFTREVASLEIYSLQEEFWSRILQTTPGARLFLSLQTRCLARRHRIYKTPPSSQPGRQADKNEYVCRGSEEITCP